MHENRERRGDVTHTPRDFFSLRVLYLRPKMWSFHLQATPLARRVQNIIAE